MTKLSTHAYDHAGSGQHPMSLERRLELMNKEEHDSSYYHPFINTARFLKDSVHSMASWFTQSSPLRRKRNVVSF